MIKKHFCYFSKELLDPLEKFYLCDEVECNAKKEKKKNFDFEIQFCGRFFTFFQPCATFFSKSDPTFDPLLNKYTQNYIFKELSIFLIRYMLFISLLDFYVVISISTRRLETTKTIITKINRRLYILCIIEYKKIQ